MIYLRVGTDANIRKKGDELFSHTTRVLRKEEIESLRQYLSADMFGNKEVIRIEDWQGEKEREFLYKHLEDIKKSENIFLIDEMSMLAPTFKKLSGFADRVFDAREEEKDGDPFKLVNYINKKDKRNAWIEFTKVKNQIPAEELQGALFWKMKTISDKSAMFDLIKARYETHEGVADLYDEIEKLILRI